MSDITRNNKLTAAVVAVLVALSALGTSFTTARAASEHGPVIALAVLPATTRVQRERRRRAARRSLRLGLVRRLRGGEVRSHPRGQHLRSCLLKGTRWARAPPR